MTASLVRIQRSVTSRLDAIEAQPRLINADPDEVTHPLAHGRYQSPLRYPGAKSALSSLIGELISSAQQSHQVGPVDLFVEPFAGGASTSLRLLGSGIVRRVLLADADPMVAAFWQASAAHTEDLIDRVADEHRRWVAIGGDHALERWDYWRAWGPATGSGRTATILDLATKCLFLNRTTFSGILNGTAGPIGGRAQTSKYGIGCRFNLDSIVERLRYVGHLYAADRIVDVWCSDWRQTLGEVTSRYKTLLPNRVVTYLDPPYLSKSRKLYRQPTGARGVNISDLGWETSLQHYRLAEYLRQEIRYRWILSYDFDERLVADPALYRANTMNPPRQRRDLEGVKNWRISKRRVTLNYTASSRAGRGASDELLLTTLPPRTVQFDAKLQPIA